MKIKPYIEIEDMDGQPMPDSVKEDAKNFTLKTACVNALYAQFEDEKGLSGEEKIKRYNLAEKIYAAKDKEEVDLKAEEITLLKNLIGKAYGALIVGRTYELLDPVEEKDEPEVRKEGKKGEKKIT